MSSSGLNGPGRVLGGIAGAPVEADIYVVVVHCGLPAPLNLRFRTSEQASTIADRMVSTQGPVSASDDFGQMISLHGSAVEAVVLLSIAEDLAAQGELSLMQARANARTQMRANADPELQAAARMQQMVQAGQSVPPGIIRSQ